MAAERLIKVALPEAALYVSGTVNDVPVVWTNVESNIWQARAPRSDNDVYKVDMTIVNAAGTTTTASMLVTAGVGNLITWRTEADAARADALNKKGWDNLTESEKTEWEHSIGVYNATDMNRVGAAVDYIVGRMKEVGYAPVVSTKTDWVKADIPTPAQREQYLANIRTLRAQLTVYPSTPPVPADMRHLTWQEANDIEQILVDLDDLLTKSSRSLYFSGEFFSNEV